MASIPTLPDLPNEEKLISAVEYGQLENFYQLEKANATLTNLESIFLSFKRTLESSYALQERDSDYLKSFHEQEELRRLEAEREVDTTVDQLEPSDRLDGAVDPQTLRGFGTGFGLSLGSLLRGGALAGLAVMFSDEISKVAETAFRTFFESTGFKNEFTSKLSEALGVGAGGAAIGAAFGSMIGKPIHGAVIGAVIAMGPKIEEAIMAAGGNITTATIANYSIQGATIGAMFGPKGAIVGAIIGSVIGLGKRIVEDIKKSNGMPGYFAGEPGVSGRGTGEGEMPIPGEAPPTPGPQAAPLSPALGAIAAQFESRGNVATISSGAGDPGGKSYGTYQLASKTGTMKKFLESEEGKPFAERYKLDPAQIGTDQFDQSYRVAAGTDPAGFAAAQKAFITRTHFEPVRNIAQRLGFNVDDPRVQEALFSQSVQHSLEGNKRILEKAAQEATGAGPQEQVSALYKARGEYVKGLSLPPKTSEAILSRYQQEQSAVQQIVPVGTTPMTTAVVGGTEATRVKRDALSFNMPVTTIAPVNNTTTIAQVDKRTTIVAESPRMQDPTFMRVQESNAYA